MSAADLYDESAFDKARGKGVADDLKKFIDGVYTAELTTPSLYDNETVFSQVLNRKGDQNKTQGDENKTLDALNEYLDVFIEKFQRVKSNYHTEDGTLESTDTRVQTVLKWLLNSERIRYVIANVFDSNFEANARNGLQQGIAHDSKSRVLFQACFGILSYAYRIMLRSACTKVKHAGADARITAVEEKDEWVEMFNNTKVMKAMTRTITVECSSIVVFEGCICCLASHLKGIGLKGLIPYIMNPCNPIPDDLGSMDFKSINYFAVTRTSVATLNDWDVLGHELGTLLSKSLCPLLYVKDESGTNMMVHTITSGTDDMFASITVPLVNDSTWKTATYQLVVYDKDEGCLYELQTIESFVGKD